MNSSDFPILKEKIYNSDLVYLDNAATTQKPQVVIDAISYAYSHFNANVHRGVHHLSQLATKHHENARKKVGDFLGTDNPSEIIFTKGTTDSINLLAFSLGEEFIKTGDEIVVSALEHHSNIVPWQMLCKRKQARLKVIPLKTDLSIDIDAFKSLLTEKTKIVSIAHVSNVLGIINPIEEIIRIAHSRGILVCVDAAQSAPHLPINVKSIDCDFLAFSAHKIYGPTGVGVLYGKQELLSKIPPYQGGGEMISHVSFDHTTYNELPYKFEAGTPDFIGSFALAKALDYLQEIGVERVKNHEAELIDYAQAELKKIEGVIIYALSLPKAGVISFNIKDQHPYDVGMLLDQQGVAVRTGHHCAEPLIDLLCVPATVRLSVALYNSKEDIDKFVSALKKALLLLRK